MLLFDQMQAKSPDDVSDGCDVHSEHAVYVCLNRYERKYSRVANGSVIESPLYAGNGSTGFHSMPLQLFLLHDII